jgi:hypothetical protein
VNTITNTSAGGLAQQNVPFNYNISRLYWNDSFNETLSGLFPNKYAYDVVQGNISMMDPWNSETWEYPNFGVKYSPMSLKDDYDSLSSSGGLAETCAYIDYGEWEAANDVRGPTSRIWHHARKSIFNKGWGCYQCNEPLRGTWSTTYSYAYLAVPGYEFLPNEYQMRNDSIYLQRQCGVTSRTTAA